MKKQLILHLGAHKTATTYIQDTLELNNPALQQKGIYSIPREQFREDISRPFFYPKNVDVPLDITLAQYLDAHGIRENKIIFSEENLIGLVQEQTKGNLYENSIKRLEKLKAFIADDFDIIAINFCVRNFSSYYPSLYCETLKGNDFYPFKGLKRNIINSDLTWLTALDNIQQVFPDVPLDVWMYESFKNNEDFFFSKLMFDETLPLEKINETVRKGFTNEAVEALAFFHRRFGNKFVSSQVQNTIIRDFDNVSNNKFSPFNDLENKLLKRVYFSQIVDISEKYNLIQPQSN